LLVALGRKSALKDIKRLIPYLKPYQVPIITALILGLVLSAIQVAQAQLVRKITDDVLVGKSPKMLIIIPLAIIAVYFFNGVVRFFHMFLLRFTGEKIAFDIRNELQSRYSNLSLNFHGENSSGSLISKTTNDVINIQAGLGLLADVVKEPITALVFLGYLFHLNWKLTLLSIVSLPVLILASRNLGRSVRKYSLVQQKMFEQFTDVLKETLDGIRIVKAFSLEFHMQERFRKVTDGILQIRRKILRREEISGPVFELIGAITVAGIIYFVGYQIIRGETTVGTFMAFIFALMSFQGPIKKLQDAHVRMQHTVASTQRVFAILDTPILVKDPEFSKRTVKPWPIDWQEVHFEDVSFSYGSKIILDRISLNIKRGEVVAIVGASGAGKTTLVNLLPRFFDVSGGAVKIGGVDVRDMTLMNLRAHIGLVTQDVFLFNETIRENIVGSEKLVDDVRIEGALEAAHAATFIERFPDKMETIVGERGSKLSGGERQRVSIARALFKDAPILILDEATSSLDSQSEKIVQEALDELMKGRTTFVIAHRLSTIQKAHRIIVLSEGKIAEQGSHQELLGKQGLYHKLHSTQLGTLLA
jgi:subfamily B ATP-binding cassette protein MsbA